MKIKYGGIGTHTHIYQYYTYTHLVTQLPLVIYMSLKGLTNYSKMTILPMANGIVVFESIT